MSKLATAWHDHGTALYSVSYDDSIANDGSVPYAYLQGLAARGYTVEIRTYGKPGLVEDIIRPTLDHAPQR